MKFMKYQVSLVGGGSIDDIERVEDLVGREFTAENDRYHFKIECIKGGLIRREVYFDCWGEGKEHLIHSVGLSVRISRRARPEDVIDAIMEEVEYRLGGQYEEEIKKLLELAHEEEMKRRESETGVYD